MVIRFQNLGKIKETELDLRPLTVIIGPNNSNKTYLAYSVYGVWQSLSEGNYAPLLPMALEKTSDGILYFPINRSFLEAIISNCNQTVDFFTGELEYFYQDSSRRLFSETQLHVDIVWEELVEALNFFSGRYLAFGWLRYRMAYEQDVFSFHPELTMQTDGKSAAAIRELLEEGLVHEVAFLFQRALALRLFPQPFLLPAERNALVITYKLLANRRLKLLRDERRQVFRAQANAQRQLELFRGAGEFRYPQPVEDFLDFLSDVELESGRSNTHETQKDSEPFTNHRSLQEKKKTEALASLIEKQIQNSNKTSFQVTASGGKEMMVQVDKDLRIDLYNASSSIKQLAPLLLYLRYRARENDLLIIDEPEMNLHPESQAKLLEVLAMLVNNGVHVLLTTHSPYLMAHLNNLAQGADGSAAARKRQAKSLYLQNPDALLRMDQVGAYEMRDNQLHSLKDPDYGIRWDTLSDVSVDLQQKFFQIYEEGHPPKSAKPARRTAKTADKQDGSG